jgi:hypothetical protein
MQDIEAAIGKYQRARQVNDARGQLLRRADFRFEQGCRIVHFDQAAGGFREASILKGLWRDRDFLQRGGLDLFPSPRCHRVEGVLE